MKTISPGFAWRVLVALLLGTSAMTALAQTKGRTDPADPAAPVPVIPYRSAFTDYQPFQEEKGNSWKEVNKEVADHPGMGPMGSTKDMPDMDKKAGSTPMSKESQAAMAMAKPEPSSPPAKPTAAPAGAIAGTGVVQQVDKANGKVKLTHDPIAALGWPKMTMFFRLKDSSLADQVKEGDKVDFTLEKSTSGYVISGFGKGAASHDMNRMK